MLDMRKVLACCIINLLLLREGFTKMKKKNTPVLMILLILSLGILAGCQEKQTVSSHVPEGGVRTITVVPVTAATDTDTTESEPTTTFESESTITSSTENIVTTALLAADVNASSKDLEQSTEPIIAKQVSEAPSGTKSENFKYGLTINTPLDWKKGVIYCKEQEKPSSYWKENYAPLYSVQYLSKVKGSYDESLFCVEVFNAADWNDLELMQGTTVPFGTLVKQTDKFAYVVTGTPFENPFEDPECQEALEFNTATEYVNSHMLTDLVRVGDATEQPTLTKSKANSVVSEHLYFSLNIPTSWKANALLVDSEYEPIVDGVKAETAVIYKLKSENEDLFRIYTFDSKQWDKLAKSGKNTTTLVKKDGINVTAIQTPKTAKISNTSPNYYMYEQAQKLCKDTNSFFIFKKPEF